MGKIQNRIFGLHLSIRQLMLFFILTLMLLFSIISIFTYTFFSRRALKNSVVNDTVHIVQQTKKLLDERLYKLFEQFVVFSNQSSLNNVLIKSSSQSPQKLGPRDYIEIDRDLSNLYMFNTSIVNSLIVYLNDGNASFIKGDFIFDNVNFDFAQWYGEYESGEYHWQNIHRSDLIQPVGEGQNTATLFRLIGTPDSQVNGIILLNLKEEYFKELLAQDPAFSPNYFALLSPDGITYFNSPEEKYLLDEQLTTRILTNEKTSDNLSYRLNNGEKISVIYDTILINGWKLISIIPEEKMFADVNKMTNMMIFYSAIFIIIALAISAAFSNLLIKPILQLANKVKMIGRGEKNVKFDIQANNEIGTLNDGIQEMMNRINQLIERVYLEMDNKRVAELSALQAQIQPHFLYNTLFAIKQLCELGETENANAMVSGLANFYRIGVSGGREIIPIKEEISHVESYLRIQQMRYEEDFCYSIQVDETVLSNTIIKLTLQPLVENAIYHGIKSKREFGRIVIYGRREGENVILEVRDNGAGMDKETLLGIHRMLTDTQVHTSQSYGLKNVNTRLKLQYGQEYGLSVESEIEKGTTVRVIIPVQGAQPPAVPQEEEE